MAEVLASLKKIGGSGEQYTETVLWTNPDTSATFTAQNVTLSESMGNYKYIGIRFAYGTSYKTGEYISTLLETVADFRKFGYSTSVRRNGTAICISDANNKAYERMCMYISDTSVRFGTCYQAASSTQANGNAIPLEILGVNELEHSDGSEIVFTNEMVCTPFRNTTPSGSTLTFAEAGTYIITYTYNSAPTSDADPQVVSGTMNIKKASAIAVSDNNFSGTQYKMCQRIYIAEVTAGTVIQGKIATTNSVGFAVKID